MTSTRTVTETGSVHWRDSNGELHREDGPAKISQGYRYWYKHGDRHREDGPAVICADGTKQYYLDGVLQKIVG